MDKKAYENETLWFRRKRTNLKKWRRYYVESVKEKLP
jgi:hypothetical protein